MRRKHGLHFFPSFAIGGAQRRLISLLPHLDEWSHTVFSLNGECEAATELDPDILTAEPCVLQKSSGLSLTNIRRLRKLIAEHQPDVVCTYNWGSVEALVAARLSKVEKILHFEDGFGPDEAKSRKRSRNLARRLIFKGRPQIIVPSGTLKTIAEADWAVRPSRLHLITNGVDTDHYHPVTGEEGPRIPTVGFVGALRAEKNVLRLINAVGEIRGLKLEVIGDGPLRSHLSRTATQMQIDTQFHGAVSDPADLYRGFSIFALSSDTEQMPLTVLEAMASGLPVVATDVGDIKTMVAEENRPFITPLGDDEAYTEALRHLVVNPERAKNIGQQNRQRAVDIYSQHHHIAAYRRLFG